MQYTAAMFLLGHITSAIAVCERLMEVPQILSNHPKIGVRGRVNGTHEFIFGDIPYIIPYRIKDNEIHILRVMHSSRKFPD